MKDNQKLIIGIAAVALVVGVGIGALLLTPSAQASPITDFFRALTHPFSGSGVSNSADVSSSVSLYQPVVDYENAVVNAVKKASPAVVSITISEDVPTETQCAYDPFGDLSPEFQQFFGGSDGSGLTEPCPSGTSTLQQVGGGSGFIISSDGLIVTNKHVVSDINAKYSVETADGKTYNATVLARDPSQDLAVLKISASGLPTVTLGDSGGLELGQTAIAIGNALGQFSNTVSVGVVSGLARTVTAGGGISDDAEETIYGVIQTDAAINPGNSGGPLLDLNGDVIGIDTAVASDAQNIGFAIPINEAKRDITQVQAGGQIQAPYLGVRYLPIDATIAHQQNLPVTSGALVRGSNDGAAVQPNSPALQAGVQAEDIITAIDDQAIDAAHDLATLINQYNVGDTVTLTVNRAGKTITLKATLAARPAGS